MIPRKAHAWAFWSAHVAFGLFILLLVAGGATFEGYSHVRDFISEMGASGAPQEMAVRYGAFLPLGLSLWVFTIAAFLGLPRSRNLTVGLAGLFLFSLGYVVSAFYPCDYGCVPDEPSVSQLIHNAVGLVGYLLAPGFLLLIGLAARNWPKAGMVPAVAFAGAVATAAGILGLDPESSFVGVSQRLIEGGTWATVLAVAWYLRRDAAGSH